MNCQQPIQRTIRRYVAAAKPQYALSGYRVWTPGRRDIPHAVKGVQVTCMNKLYQGIGFRNDNGGLEFYSDDCKKRLASKIEAEIDVLRERLEMAEDELDDIIYNLAMCQEHIGEWRSTFQQLEEEYQQIQEQLECLVLHTSEVDVSDKGKLRYQLKKDLRLNKTRRAEKKKLIDGYQECFNRKCFLELFIKELHMKIEQKEKDAIASSTLTVEQHGILTLHFLRGTKSKACCVFADVLDYLAYVYLANDNKTAGFPKNCDSVILNDPRNFVKLLLYCDTYDKIYCFLPDTISGKTMEETVIKRHGSRAMSMTQLYNGYVTLFSYSTSTNDFSPLNLIR